MRFIFKQTKPKSAGSLIVLLALSVSCFGMQPLSLEEKVGQLLMVHCRGEYATEEAKVLIQETKVGGIIYYNWANGLDSPEQVLSLSEGLQKLAAENNPSIPLLIAADQEGGIVARLGRGFTKFPGNRALGSTRDVNLAEAAAFAMGQELAAVGINMNLAPVVDVNIEPRNPIIGVRSYGEDPEIVSAFGKSALEGTQKAGIIPTLKHFPGHGDTITDSHQGLPVLRKSKEQLERIELVPFARLAPYAEAIMTAHILVPALDPEHCATTSAKILGYLRETLGFQGLIVSDSLVMEGVLQKCGTVDEAAIQALQAGCDLLILGGKLLGGEKGGFELTVPDIQRIHRAIVQAVKSGRLEQTRIDLAVARVLTLKQRKIMPAKETPSLSETVNTAAHQALSKEIASKALQMTKRGEMLHFQDQKVVVVAPQILSDATRQTSLLQIGKTTSSYFFSGLAPTVQEIEAAGERAKDADILLVCSYNAWKNPSQIDLIHSLIDIKKPVVLLVMRDPLDASLFSQAQLIFNTFSPSVPSLQAVCDVLVNFY